MQVEFEIIILSDRSSTTGFTAEISFFTPPIPSHPATLNTIGFLRVQRLRGEPWESQTSRIPDQLPSFIVFPPILSSPQVRGL